MMSDASPERKNQFRVPTIARVSFQLAANAAGQAKEGLRNRAANDLMLRKIAGFLVSRPPRGATIAQRLGFDSGARLVIINADDFGLCGEQNRATIEGLEGGLVSCASVMVPCAGFGEACEYARRRPDADLGVHLTLNSEWTDRRWGPVLQREKVSSLVDREGYLWRIRAQVFSECKAEEAQAELRAQIEGALAAGLDVTHLNSHMFVLHSQRMDLQQVYLRLASDYSLPLRAARGIVMHWNGFSSLPAEADRLGLLHPDHFAVLSRLRPSCAPSFWRALLHALPPGLTEICCHPGYATGDLASFAADAAQREADFHFFTSEHTRQLIEFEDIQLVGYRLLRDAMRSTRNHGI